MTLDPTPALLGVALLLAGCDNLVSFPAVALAVTDDDDTANDDDATDDDDVADDDDVTDDDDVADDDDSTEPDPPMLGGVYCMDWATIDVTSPTGLWEVLAGLGAVLDASPPILEVTAVDVAAQRIWMDVGLGDNSCVPGGMSALTPPKGGAYVDPHFEAGPGTMSFGEGSFVIPLLDALATGDFTVSADEIVDGTLTGALDLSGLFGACALLSCGPCPSGGNDCVGFAAEAIVWTRID